MAASFRSAVVPARSDELFARRDGFPLRFLLVDGWHSYDAVTSDLQRDLLPSHRAPAGRMRLFHDRPLPANIRRYLRIPWG